MRIGIVGHEAAKFTAETEAKAREIIRSLLQPGDVVVSGACHLGGVDIFAVDEAKKLGLAYKEWPPRSHSWPHYKARNIQIAEDSDRVYCLSVDEYPEGYKGMRFSYCYHCHATDHKKGGGCWTVKYAKSLGKPGDVIVIKTKEL